MELIDSPEEIKCLDYWVFTIEEGRKFQQYPKTSWIASYMTFPGKLFCEPGDVELISENELHMECPEPCLDLKEDHEVENPAIIGVGMVLENGPWHESLDLNKPSRDWVISGNHISYIGNGPE